MFVYLYCIYAFLVSLCKLSKSSCFYFHPSWFLVSLVLEFHTTIIGLFIHHIWVHTSYKSKSSLPSSSSSCHVYGGNDKQFWSFLWFGMLSLFPYLNDWVIRECVHFLVSSITRSPSVGIITIILHYYEVSFLLVVVVPLLTHLVCPNVKLAPRAR